MLLVCGWSRTGSTLLGDVLGATSGAFHTGELRGIWHHMQPESETTCGCGAEHRDCPFWAEVFKRAFPNENPRDLRYLEHMRERRFSMRPRPALALRRDLTSDPPAPIVTEYAERLTRIYRAIADTSGCELIVDSSKDPGYARLVTALVDLPTYVLHLVRDPRGVAYSWQRRPIFHMTPGPVRCASSWLAANLLTESLLRGIPTSRSRSLRYEDLIRDPRRSFAAMRAWLGLSAEDPEWRDERTVRLGQNHTVTGNPSRFAVGDITLELDDDWSSRLGEPSALAATLPALPRLRSYGYPLAPRGRLGSPRPRRADWLAAPAREPGHRALSRGPVLS